MCVDLYQKKKKQKKIIFFKKVPGGEIYLVVVLVLVQTQCTQVEGSATRVLVLVPQVLAYNCYPAIDTGVYT